MGGYYGLWVLRDFSDIWLISCGTFGISFSLTKPLVQEELELLERMGSASASCNE